MIGRLRGQLIELEGSVALLEACGVGYEVGLPDAVAMGLPPIGSEAILLIRQVFREDGVSLYGFLTRFQRRLFDLLLEVKGCGPKVALSLIGQVGEDAVATAIMVQDPRPLIRATGVGARLAERVILELKGKIEQEVLQRKLESVSVPVRAAPKSDELVDALLALDYRRNDAEMAASAAREAETDLPSQIRHALKVLQRQ